MADGCVPRMNPISRSFASAATLGLALVALVPACHRRAQSAAVELRVHAASSLADVLPRIYAAWPARNTVRVAFNFDASSRLARELESGAPGDLFFAADREWLDHLDQRTRIARDTRVDLVGNRLVLVVPRASAWNPTSPSDLNSPELERLALAGAAVPAGRYARAALRSAGLWPLLEPRVVTGDSVRATLSWVARGEANAGIVYATDATIDARVRLAFVFPRESHPPIVYPAAVLAGSSYEAQARRFLAFCQHPSARAIFTAAGFEPLAPSAP